MTDEVDKEPAQPAPKPAYWNELTEEQRRQKEADNASLLEKLKRSGKYRPGPGPQAWSQMEPDNSRIQYRLKKQRPWRPDLYASQRS